MFRRPLIGELQKAVKHEGGREICGGGGTLLQKYQLDELCISNGVFQKMKVSRAEPSQASTSPAVPLPSLSDFYPSAFWGQGAAYLLWFCYFIQFIRHSDTSLGS